MIIQKCYTQHNTSVFADKNMETTCRSYRKEVDFKDHEVKRHGQHDGTDQPSIEPRWHHYERLVL